MYDWNGSIRSLNVGLPDDIARLKAAGYYQEAIARIDRLQRPRTARRPTASPRRRGMSRPRTPRPTVWTPCGRP